MSIPAACPHCGANYKLPDAMDGKKVVCRHCNKAFDVRAWRRPAPETFQPEPTRPPARSYEEEAPGRRAPAARPKRSDRDDEESQRERQPNYLPWILAGAAAAVMLLAGGVAAVWIVFHRGSPPPALVASNDGPEKLAADAGDAREVQKAAVQAAPVNLVETRPAETPAPSVPPPSAPEVQTAGSGRLSPEVLRRLKESTVFIKREAGRLSATGSGFVMKLDGEAAYIVTNHHVIDPSAEMLSISRSGRLQVVRMRAASAVILAVFRSGTKEERALSAQVVATDSSRDLAVLKVNGVKDYARAIDLEQKAELIETMPVYILGFPFGQTLSMKKGNPNITINKGSISSLRDNDQGQMKAVQIDGALNPGNSGGPVVDEQGRLVGVSVATIEGSGIGLAIAPEELTRLLLGRVGGVTFNKKAIANQLVTLDIQAQLIDPMNRIKSVFVHYARANPAREKPRMDGDGRFPPLAEAQDLELKIDDQHAAATLQLPVTDNAPYDIEYQMAIVNGAGVLTYTAPASYRVDARMGQTAPPPFITKGPMKPPMPNFQNPGLPNSESTTPSGEALWANAGTVGDVDIKEVPLDVGNFPACLCWAANGQSFYCLSSSGVVRRVSLTNLETALTRDLGRPCSWLTMSASGPIVTVNSSQEAWLLNLQFKTTKKFAIASANQVVSSPTLSIAIACNADRFTGGMTVLDLKKGGHANQYRPQDLGSFTGVSWPVVTPDGKYLFVQGGIEELKSIRINGTRLFPEGSSTRIATNGQRIDVSPDSKYVCLPSGGGNTTGYATFIYSATNLSKPRIALASGAYPRAVGFDPKAGLIYAQNFQNQLIIYDPSGIKIKEFKLGPGGDVKQFLVHPEGRKLLVLTGTKLYYVQVRPGE